MEEVKNTTAIILAAGLGSRLGMERTKSLVEVSGRPLIAYALNFLRHVGVGQVVVVGGYQFPELKKTIAMLDPEVEVRENTRFKDGNLHSLEKGLEGVDGSFLLFHADHVFHKNIAPVVRGALDGERLLLCTDTDRTLTNDDMKVRVDEQGAIREVSKQLTDFDRGYVGIQYCGSARLPEYKTALQKAREKYGDNAVTEHVIQYIADEGTMPVYTHDISGHGWLEIDFPDELERAEEKISEKESEFFDENGIT